MKRRKEKVDKERRKMKRKSKRAGIYLGAEPNLEI